MELILFIIYVMVSNVREAIQIGSIANNKYFKYLLFFIVFLILLFTRIYKIESVPYGLHVDEAGMAYDAWSIAYFGVDRYLNPFPVYFINYGGGQSVLYGYLSALLIKFFGLTIYTIRLPGIILSVLTGIVGFKIIEKLFNSFYFGLLFLLIFSITPYFIMQSRFGLDCNLMMGMSSIVLYFLDQMILSDNYIYSIIAGVVTGLILYSYALSYIVLPIFLLFLLFYVWRTRKLSLRKISVFIITLIIVALPLIALVVINYFKLGTFRLLWFTIPQLPGFRGSEIVLDLISDNFLRIINSVLFYDWLPYNTFSHHLTLYRISIPFVVLGIVIGFINIIRDILKREYSILNIIWLFGLATFLMGLTIGGDQPNTNKLNGIFFSVAVLLIYGINYSFKAIKRWNLFISKIFLATLMLTYTYHFISFARYYYFRYQYEINPQYLFAHTFEDAYEFLDSHTNVDTDIYIEPNYHGYVYFLLSAQISPYDINLNFNGTKMYQNYHFELPHDIIADGIYLVSKTNSSFISRIEEMSFIRMEFERYYLYIYAD